MSRLDDIASTFVIDPYLRVGSGASKRSSFLSGTLGALVFYWQAPETAPGVEGKVYVVRTQAPFVIEAMQRAIGARVDGQFGDATRRLAVAAMRADGVEVPDDLPPLGPMMGYLLAKALFQGRGSVAFPARVDWPNIATATRASGSQSMVATYDIDAGRDVPIGANGLPAAAVPAPPPAPLPETAPPPAPPPSPPPPAPIDRLAWAYPTRAARVTQDSTHALVTGVAAAGAVVVTGLGTLAKGR